jgi:hypothetical protein
MILDPICDTIQPHNPGEDRSGNVGWYLADWQDRRYGDVRTGMTYLRS